MVGMNLSGVVSGSELRQVTQEIFGKAQGYSPKAMKSTQKEEAPQASRKQVGFSRKGSKAAKAGHNLNNVEMNESMQSKVKAQAAIDRYGQLSFNSNVKNKSNGQIPEMVEAQKLLDAYGAKKDRDGKNPFSFFNELTNKEEVVENNDFSKSIFAIAN